MRTGVLAGIGCLLLIAFSQAALGARQRAGMIASSISGTAIWTPTSSSQGKLKMSWTGVSEHDVQDGFILVNDSRETTSTSAGAMLVTPCPRNTCETADGASFDFFAQVGMKGSSGSDEETMDVPNTGHHWYVQFEAESGRSGAAYSPMGLSSIIDVPAAGLSSKPKTGDGSSGSSSKAAVQVAEGYATVMRNGEEIKCTPSNCPLTGWRIGDEVSTGASTYLRITTKQWGAVRVGPNTKFTISEHFADIASGSIDYALGHEQVERIYVAPIPPLGYVGRAPKAYTAEVQPATKGAGLDAFISATGSAQTARVAALARAPISPLSYVGGTSKAYTAEMQTALGTSGSNAFISPSGASQTGRVAASARATPKVLIDVISGAAKVSDHHGHTRVVKAGREQQLAGGKLKKPTLYSQASCSLQGKGYGAFCGNGTSAAGGQSLPTGAIALFESTYFYCCWSGANLKLAWTSGGDALAMSWQNPGSRFYVSIIYLGSTIRAPGLLWPADDWRYWWDTIEPSVTSFTLTRADYQSRPEAVSWAKLREGGLYFQVNWSCGINYNDRQAGVTCDGPVSGQADVDLWSTLAKVPAG